MTITNYISQIANSNRFALRQTYGKIVLDPEMVSDCPGVCHLHFQPISFAEIVNKELSKIIGDESTHTVKREFVCAIGL
jgi:hypothetical protein